MTDPVAIRLDRWKRRLIDLTKRNRLLSFKPTPVTTICVVNELASEVFRLLCLESRTMTFLPLKETRAENVSSDVGGPGEAGEANAEEFRAIDRTLLEGHHTDTKLQTNLPSDKLEHNLLRIYQTASGILGEQGVNALFLSLGMLEWYEAGNSEVVLKAPLVLLPVELSRQNVRSIFTLKATQDDPILNPALVEKLKIDCQLSLPPLPETVEDFEPQEYFAQIQTTISERPRWRVTNEIYLGLFTFQKFVMYKDLEVNEEHYRSHPAIQALSYGKSDRIKPISEQILGAKLDQVLRPETTLQVLDADSSQQRALLAVKEGYDLVVIDKRQADICLPAIAV